MLEPRTSLRVRLKQCCVYTAATLIILSILIYLSNSNYSARNLVAVTNLFRLASGNSSGLENLEASKNQTSLGSSNFRGDIIIIKGAASSDGPKSQNNIEDFATRRTSISERLAIPQAVHSNPMVTSHFNGISSGLRLYPVKSDRKLEDSQTELNNSTATPSSLQISSFSTSSLLLPQMQSVTRSLTLLASEPTPSLVTSYRTPKMTPSISVTRGPSTTHILRHTAVPETRKDRFVTFSGGFKDGRGLGNQMFDIAACVYVATLSGRTFVMENVSFVQMVDEAFNFSSVLRTTSLCPCHDFNEMRPLMYDPRVEDLGQPGHHSFQTRTIMMGGFYQSWRYTRNIETQLRNLFTFKEDILDYAKGYLSKNYPPGWTNAFVRVAIHVRRGDHVGTDKLKFGYTVPSVSYFQNAMKYFLTNYGRTQFIVVSQDTVWTQKNIIRPESIPPYDVNITYAFGNTAAQDMAIMASCDHVIMSVGTFGWWAGFLAKGVTIYYSDWPRMGSQLYRAFRRGDFYPPYWKGMDNVQFTTT